MSNWKLPIMCKSEYVHDHKNRYNDLRTIATSALDMLEWGVNELSDERNLSLSDVRRVADKFKELLNQHR